MKFVIYVYVISSVFCAVSYFSFLHRMLQTAKMKYGAIGLQIIKGGKRTRPPFIQILLIISLCLLPVLNLIFGFIWIAGADEYIKTVLAKCDNYIDKAHKTEQNSGKGGS